MMRLYFPHVGGQVIADFDSVCDCIFETMKYFENKVMPVIALYKENLHPGQVCFQNKAFSWELKSIYGFPK